MTKRRRLLPNELNLIPSSFRSTVNIGNVTLIDKSHNIFISGRAMARPNKIYWPDCPDDFTKASIVEQATLMHELCHIWQYNTDRLSAWGYLTNKENQKYEYSFDPIKKFDDYPTEKQADLMQDWYYVNNGYAPSRFNAKRGITPTKDQINKVVPFQWT